MKLQTIETIGKSRRRLDFVDIARGLASFTVVLGHTVPVDSVTKILVTSYNMPLFFMLSAFFLKPIELMSLNNHKKYFVKKFVSLMFPFFLWGLIYMEFSFPNLAKLSYGSWQMLRSCHSLSSLLFLPVLFISLNLVYCIDSFKSLFKNVLCKYIIDVLYIVACISVLYLFPVTLAVGLPWGMNIALFASIFLVVGKYIRHVFVFFETKRKLVLSALPIFLITYVTIYNYGLPDIGYVRVSDAHFGNLFICIGKALVGCITVILASIAISWIHCKNNILCVIGANTIGIYLIHKPLVWLVRSVVIKIGISVEPFFVCLIIALFVMAVSLCLTLWINRYFPFLFAKHLNL